MGQEILKKVGFKGYSRDSVESYIKQLDTTFAEKERDLCDRIKELEYALKNEEEESASLQAALDDKTAACDEQAAEIARLKEEISAQQELIAKQQKHIFDLEHVNADLSIKIAHLPEISEKLTSLVAELETGMNDIKTQAEEKITAFKDTYLQ